jgi:hypothetical protein
MGSNFNLPKEIWHQFEQDAAGKPVVYTTNVIIRLATDQDAYSIEDKSRLNYHYLVGLDVTIPEATPQKIESNLTCASEAVLAATKLNLKKDTGIVCENLSIKQIVLANKNGYSWQGYTGLVNIAESEVKNYNPSAIGTGTGIELIVHYCKFAMSNRPKASAI